MKQIREYPKAYETMEIAEEVFDKLREECEEKIKELEKQIDKYLLKDADKYESKIDMLYTELACENAQLKMLRKIYERPSKHHYYIKGNEVDFYGNILVTRTIEK